MLRRGSPSARVTAPEYSGVVTRSQITPEMSVPMGLPQRAGMHEAAPLLQRDVAANRREPIQERPWHLRSLPAPRDLEAVLAIAERARDNEFSLRCQLVKARDDCLVDARIGCVNRFDPLAHVELAKLSAVGRDARMRGDRLA